ncbi:hypothetical protein TNCV_3521321 [Trichonephila clavipes]|nr:hypothetical protein TNCV_3521321 [Trichonephila clavipes]
MHTGQQEKRLSTPGLDARVLIRLVFFSNPSNRHWYNSLNHNHTSKPAERRSWFVAGLLHLRLRVRPRPISVDFHDAENRQRPYRMIMQHVKDPLSASLAL